MVLDNGNDRGILSLTLNSSMLSAVRGRMKKTAYKGPRNEVRALSAYVKLMRAAETVAVRSHRHLADAKLSASQFGVLEALYHLGPMSQAGLSQKILKSSGNMTMVIDNLEKRVLIKRQRSPDDRRLNVVELTVQGKQLIANVFPRHAGEIMASMSALTKAEQDTLGNLCRKLGLGQQ